MSACKERDSEFFDDMVLADDDFGELFTKLLVGLAQLVDGSDIVFGQIRARGRGLGDFGRAGAASWKWGYGFGSFVFRHVQLK